MIDHRSRRWFQLSLYKLAAMSAYRQKHVSEELIAAGQVPPDGYLVPR